MISRLLDLIVISIAVPLTNEYLHAFFIFKLFILTAKYFVSSFFSILINIPSKIPACQLVSDSKQKHILSGVDRFTRPRLVVPHILQSIKTLLIYQKHLFSSTPLLSCSHST